MSSETYKIEKDKKSKLVIIIPILIIAVILIVVLLFVLKPTPKSVVKSFINAMQNYNYNKIEECIDFDIMTALEDVDNDISKLDNALDTLNNMSTYQKVFHNESVSANKKFIKSTLNDLKEEKLSFKSKNITVSDVKSNDNVNKVVVELSINENNKEKTETLTFYTIKKDDSYLIINFSGDLLF